MSAQTQRIWSKRMKTHFLMAKRSSVKIDSLVTHLRYSCGERNQSDQENRQPVEEAKKKKCSPHRN